MRQSIDLGPLMQTYSLRSPLATHFRPASCAEVRCPAYAAGWVTRVPAGSQLEGLVRTSGRHWVAEVRDGAEVVFSFEAGTSCFRAASHRTPLDRPEQFIVRTGRGPARLHTRPADWVEDLAEHLEKVADDRR